MDEKKYTFQQVKEFLLNWNMVPTDKFNTIPFSTVETIITAAAKWYGKGFAKKLMKLFSQDEDNHRYVFEPFSWEEIEEAMKDEEE